MQNAAQLFNKFQRYDKITANQHMSIDMAGWCIFQDGYCTTNQMAAAPEILGQSSRVTEAQRGSVLEHF
jgi:hypothetical protein